MFAGWYRPRCQWRFSQSTCNYGQRGRKSILNIWPHQPADGRAHVFVKPPTVGKQRFVAFMWLVLTGFLSATFYFIILSNFVIASTSMPPPSFKTKMHLDCRLSLATCCNIIWSALGKRKRDPTSTYLLCFIHYGFSILNCRCLGYSPWKLVDAHLYTATKPGITYRIY